MAKSSPKSLTKVCYKPSTQSGDEFIVIVNPEEVSVLRAVAQRAMLMRCIPCSTRNGSMIVSGVTSHLAVHGIDFYLHRLVNMPGSYWKAQTNMVMADLCHWWKS